MRAKILKTPGYSFSHEVVGKIYDVHDIDVDSAYLVIDHEHDVNIKYPAGEVWRFDLEDVQLLEDNEVEKFTIGSQVLLNPKSVWVTQGVEDIFNPVGVVGEITDCNERLLELGELGITVKWSNGVTNNYHTIDLTIVENKVEVSEKPSVRKVKQSPKRREQTIVYFVYLDGTDYEQRRAKGVVINAEHKAIHVDSERNLGKGLVVRENSTVPFKLLEAVRVSTPDGEFCYYFTNGELTGSAREFNARLPFKTQTH